MAKAKKSSSKRSRSAKKTMVPAVRYLRYDITNSGNTNTEVSTYIDLAKDLSAINRRLYRQGRKYHVKRISITSKNTNQLNPGQSAGRISVSTCPESWVSQMAWRRGMKVWMDKNKEASRLLASDISSTWSDFKVYLSDDHRTGTVATPIDNGGNAVNAGEWTYSKIVTPDGTTSDDHFFMHLLGDHNGGAGSRVSVGLIKSYGESRATVDTDQPNINTDVYNDPLVNAMDDGTDVDETLAFLADDNDNAPYQTVNYPGDNGNMPKPLVVYESTLGTDGKTTFGGFQVMCGLLELETTSPIANDVYSVLVELAAGSFRGIKADVI